MLTHGQIWDAIDALAESRGLSASGLARKAGLDPTAFNPSKRISRTHKARWPSTESVSRVLLATGASLAEFVAYIEELEQAGLTKKITVPVMKLDGSLGAGCFDEDGRPTGKDWGSLDFPAGTEDPAWALEISDARFEPVFRKGAVIVVASAERVSRGDRVAIAVTGEKDLLIGATVASSAGGLEIEDLSSTAKQHQVQRKNILWISRIIWASQ